MVKDRTRAREICVYVCECLCVLSHYLRDFGLLGYLWKYLVGRKQLENKMEKAMSLNE